ncbi:MAG: DUF1801 domain-containing protein [Chloroflexi bacterium]|nr:DUF1801 domain-containing protein [Chloroflexota bacterium]MCY4247870.1 DUF1801 domain-containing protein [Chloroflexota bacterium]
MSKSKPLSREEAIKRIDNFVAEHDDWRGETMAQIRQIIHEVAPDVVEDWKYMGSPFWSREGILGHGNIFKAKVKLTLHHGARLPDPKRLFNASLNASQSRAIDMFEGEAIDVAGLKALLREAVLYNATHTVNKSKGSRDI